MNIQFVAPSGDAAVFRFVDRRRGTAVDAVAVPLKPAADFLQNIDRFLWDAAVRIRPDVQQQIAAAVDTCNETADQIQGDILSAKDGYIGVSETVNQLSGDITRKNQLYENMINLLDQVDPIVEEVQKTHINI